MDKTSFMECDTCRAKPGSPTLCLGCLHNREAIGLLSKKPSLSSRLRDVIPELRKLKYEGTATTLVGIANAIEAIGEEGFTIERIEALRTQMKGALSNLWTSANVREAKHKEIDELCDLAIRSLKK